MKMAQRSDDNRIKITHLVNPHFFYFKWMKDEGFHAELNELEAKIQDIATNRHPQEEGEAKFKSGEVVAVFVSDWNKYVRAAIRRKEMDDSYVVWAYDYGIPLLSSAKFIVKLPRAFSGMVLKKKLIHRGGIENCLPAETKFDIETGSSVKRKLSNWTSAAIELTQNIINRAIKLEFEHVNEITPFHRPHSFGRLMMQRQDGQMVNVIKCLLEMDMAVLVDGDFKYELSTIESLAQPDWKSINGDSLNAKVIVAPVLNVINETGFSDHEIFDDDEDNCDFELNNEMSMEDNTYFDESVSMFGPITRDEPDTEQESQVMMANELQAKKSNEKAKFAENNSKKNGFQHQNGNAKQNITNGSHKSKQTWNKAHDFNDHSISNKQTGNIDHRLPNVNRSNMCVRQAPFIGGNFNNNFPRQQIPLISWQQHQPLEPHLHPQQSQQYTNLNLNRQQDFGRPEFSASLGKPMGATRCQNPYGPPPATFAQFPPQLPQHSYQFGPQAPINFQGMFGPMPPSSIQHKIPTQTDDMPLKLDNVSKNFSSMNFNPPNGWSNGPNSRDKTQKKHENNRNRRKQNNRKNQRDPNEVNEKNGEMTSKVTKTDRASSDNQSSSTTSAQESTVKSEPNNLTK